MAAIALFHESFGKPDAPSIVILHGLLGNGRNWARVARALADSFSVHVLDLRNHGRSPAGKPMTYAAMAEDVEAWLDQHTSGPVHLAGHSMGGKVAMSLACHAPHRLRSLLVVDIAPKIYAPRWKEEFAAMRSLDVESYESRAQADADLEPAVPSWAFRQFLLTNLERRPEGGFRWQVDLALLEAALPDLFAHPLGEDAVYAGPALFMRGARSDYIRDGDAGRIRRHFPAAALHTVDGAGHNVHFEQPDAFLTLAERFWASA